MPVQNSLSSIRRNLEPSAYSTGILALGQCKHTETNVGPLPQVREDVGSSTSTLPTLGTLPPSPREPGRHSSFTQGDAETFPSGQGHFTPLQSAQGPLTLSISAQAMTHSSGSAEGAQLHSAPSPAFSEKKLKFSIYPRDFRHFQMCWTASASFCITLCKSIMF